jgi:hypothetical protein
MDEHHRMLVAAAAICIHQLLVSYFIIFDDVPTASEARAAKRHMYELTPYKRNLSVEYGRLTTNLEHIPHLERILQDINRPYMKDVTHLHGWQFFLLANCLKDLIKRPRLHPNGTHSEIYNHKKCYLDHYHRLYYCLKWLNDGNFYWTQEADIGYHKSSIQEDTGHVLQAIVEGLEDELQWPDTVNERRSWSGKKRSILTSYCL